MSHQSPAAVFGGLLALLVLGFWVGVAAGITVAAYAWTVRVLGP